MYNVSLAVDVLVFFFLSCDMICCWMQPLRRNTGITPEFVENWGP